jgi:uncharacterized protein YejL (UPF0352 family)
MNKEEIYNKIINEETSKNPLLNEIYAIRDKRKETQDFTIYVDGCISVDVLNRSLDSIPKQKIRAKIRELENMRDTTITSEGFNILNGEIIVLKEILGEEEK